MKVQNIKNIDKFFKVVDQCKGRVELVTGEGRQTEPQIKAEPVRFHGKYFLKR